MPLLTQLLIIIFLSLLVVSISRLIIKKTIDVDDHDFSNDAVPLCSMSPEMAKEIPPSTKVSLPHLMHTMLAEVSNVLHD